MSDPRYIIEITTSTTDAGVVNVKAIGEMVLTTTDPVEADQFRKTLAGLLRQPGVMDGPVHVALSMETVERRRVLCAFNEDHFRTRPDRSAAVALAVETPGAKPGFDVAMNEAAAAMKSLLLIDNYLCGNTGSLSYGDLENIALSLEHYGLTNAVTRSTIRRGSGVIDGELKMALAELSATVRAFPVQFPAEVYNQDRYELVCTHLKGHNPNSMRQQTDKLCLAQADMDIKSCQGRIVEVRFVNGYDLGTNNQNDHVLGEDEDPYRVVVVGCDDLTSQWNDADLDPKWDVRPAPDETRLDGLRSLWTFGPSYFDASYAARRA